MPPRRRQPDIYRENQERWLLTYADLITLLAAFFIVMYSMSQIDAKKFGEMTEALNGLLRGGKSVLKYDKAMPATSGDGLLKLGNLTVVRKQLIERFQNLSKENILQTEITERGLIIHIMESALFSEGSADLENKAVEILDLVADRIVGLPNHIRIEGHTDDRTIETMKYPSNWELSAARATEVVRYLIDNHNIPSDKISALGYGQFRPVKPNTSIENRALNRRVDVLILTMELTMKEPTSQMYYLTSRP